MKIHLNFTTNDFGPNGHFHKEAPVFVVVDDENNVLELSCEEDRMTAIGQLRTVWVSKAQVKKLSQWPFVAMTAKVAGHKIRIYEH